MIVFCFGSLVGCQVGYLAKNGYKQVEVLSSRRPMTNLDSDQTLSEEEKRKLKLAAQAKTFAVEKLGLKNNSNYSTYVKLKHPYVSWLITASPKNKIESKKWWFPIVGEFPYLGFFDEADAVKEFDKLQKQNWDVHRRGVSAFSTLGWFSDPVLSSMLKYDDFDLVNTIIHETVHATIFIKSSTDFNERLATYIGNVGALQFYEQILGANHPDLERFRQELADELLFAQFITEEIKNLDKWYLEQKEQPLEQTAVLRIEQFQKIKDNFKSKLKPKLKRLTYQRFLESELNNAVLAGYRTYLQDLSQFEKLFLMANQSVSKMIEICKKFEASKNPEEELKKIISLE